MSLGIWQILLIAVLVLLFFGRGRVSDLMGDVAKGITSFKKGLKEEDEAVKSVTEAKADTADTVKDGQKSDA